jgi:hypothetical protein
MRRTNLRHLEALEKEERIRKQKELDALREALEYIWMIVLGYYLGDLKSESWEAEARALKYPSDDARSKAISEDILKYLERWGDAYRRLFAKAGLDFDRASSRVLFEAFVTMVNHHPIFHVSFLIIISSYSIRRKLWRKCRVSTQIKP